MLVNTQKATELTGVSRSTITRHVKAGKLSRDANKMFDTSELIRVYGEIKQVTDSSMIKQPDKSMSNREQWLMNQIDELKHDMKQLKNESLKREGEAVEREKRLMALLENKAGIEPEKDKSLFGRLFK